MIILRADHQHDPSFLLLHGIDLAFAPTVLKYLSENRTPPPAPTGHDRRKTAAVVAYVNHGRWIADCPYCPSAQLTSPDDPRFFCANCLNAAGGGQYVSVRFPKDPEAIEAALVRRPRAENRNWLPHESPEDLHAQNADLLEPAEPGPVAVIRGRRAGRGPDELVDLDGDAS